MTYDKAINTVRYLGNCSPVGHQMSEKALDRAISKVATDPEFLSEFRDLRDFIEQDRESALASVHVCPLCFPIWGKIKDIIADDPSDVIP